MGEAWKTLVDKVFERDVKCQRCEETSRNMMPHHIKPRSEQGRDSLDNLILLCDLCHDWVEVHLEFEPALRTKPGIIGSFPSIPLQDMRSTRWFSAGSMIPGDKADIWTLWIKNGRKGAVDLIKKYGGTFKPISENDYEELSA